MRVDPDGRSARSPPLDGLIAAQQHREAAGKSDHSSTG
jgi:hypothetical protein